MAIFFTSDMHYNHANIIKYCSRPFSNVEEMNTALIHGWNETISDRDDVYLLGDLCLYKKNTDRVSLILEQLQGRIYWIKGNHDASLARLSEFAFSMPKKLVWTGSNMVLFYGRKEYFLTHNPMDCHTSMPTIAGHVHKSWRAIAASSSLREVNTNRVIIASHPVLNVGVDVWNFKPVPIAQALQILEQGPYDQPLKPI